MEGLSNMRPLVWPRKFIDMFEMKKRNYNVDSLLFLIVYSHSLTKTSFVNGNGVN